MIDYLSRSTRDRLHLEGGGYQRRDHRCALAQHIKVDDDEVRIREPKTDLLRMLVAALGGQSACPAEDWKWRAAPDEDENYEIIITL